MEPFSPNIVRISPKNNAINIEKIGAHASINPIDFIMWTVLSNLFCVTVVAIPSLLYGVIVYVTVDLNNKIIKFIANIIIDQNKMNENIAATYNKIFFNMYRFILFTSSKAKQSNEINNIIKLVANILKLQFLIVSSMTISISR